MFDSLPTEPGHELLSRIRCFCFDHGHDLAEAAALLGGPAAEARVVSCGIELERATRITRRLRQDLIAIHRLLGLHDVGDPERLETELFSCLHPYQPEVEAICLLTDQLEDLLRDLDAHRMENASVGYANASAAP